VSHGPVPLPRPDFSWGATAADKPAAPTKYEQAMQRADSYAVRAGQPLGRKLRRAHRTLLAKHAISGYEAAALANPTKPAPHLRAAELINAHFLRGNGPPNRFTAMRAIRHWDAFIRLAPLDPRINEFMFRRSILFTRLGTTADLKRALADYDRLIRSTKFSSESPSMAAQTISNMAEVHMMLGQLDKAIAKYRRALELTPNKALYGYGLAVALDRDGQGTKAREVMLTHGAGDRLRELSSAGVFFVPKAEIHYYLALGYESLGYIEQAIAEYRKFIASRAHPKYQPRAKQNLDFLMNLKRGAPARVGPLPRLDRSQRRQR
jgi:tetratricopeptide (TPR) repeat protein